MSICMISENESWIDYWVLLYQRALLLSAQWIDNRGHYEELCCACKMTTWCATTGVPNMDDIISYYYTSLSSRLIGN